MEMLIYKILEYKNVILYSLLGVFVALFVFFKWQKGGGGADFIAAETAYRSWSSNPSSNQEILERLLKSIDKHPELHQKYDAVMQQKMLAWGQTGLFAAAQTFQKELPSYAKFAQTSLLIGKKDFKAALLAAKELKESMQNEKGTLLYAFNLLRIASLEKEIGSKEQERAAWQELCLAESYPLLESSFHLQDASLKQYITYNK